MELIKVKDYEEMTEKLLEIFVEQLKNKPDSVLSFTTGATPKGLLERLAEEINNGLDVSESVFCNLDEYVCGKEKVCSVYHFMNSCLYDKIDKKPKEMLMFNGEAANQEEELKRYEKLMEKYPRNIQLLGLGSNAHIGANEPGTPFDSKMFVADSLESTIEATKNLFHMTMEEVPTQMYTLGFKEIMAADRVILAAAGKSKAEAVKKVIQGEITEDIPASKLKEHPNFIFIIDEEAASLLYEDDK